MNENQLDRPAIERQQKLQLKRRQILSLPPEKAMEAILQDSNPAALVHSFPEQDFYFLVHDIGPEDCLPLLALASDRQWDHMLDLEAWQKDRIDVRAVSRWLELLLEADPQRFIRWTLQHQLELVKFFLFKNIEVRIREHDQDPSEFGDDYFSLDNTYFIRFIKAPPALETDKLEDDRRRQLVSRLLQRMADTDHRLYQKVLLEATHLLAAETEEECYRWRNVRLAEKGFLPFEESVGIYQPVKASDLKKLSPKFIPRTADAASLMPVPLYPFGLLKEDNHFTRALTAIEPEGSLPHLQAEFASLCNQIIVADHKTVRDREALRRIVKKACGYVSMGIERLSEKQTAIDPHRAAALITRFALVQLFRLGFAAALQLKWQVEKWLAGSWFAGRGLRLTFWGEQWLGVLGGLLLKKPLFYDNYKTGVLYREFASLEDVQAMEDVYRQIKAVDDLLSLITVELDPPAAYGFLTYKNLLLTRWAQHCVKAGQLKLQPLTLPEFIPFFEQLLPGPAGAADGPPRKIPLAMKQHFLNWLAVETGLQDFEITERLGQTFESLFDDIEAELGRVATRDLDARYINLFLLKHQ